MSKITLSALPPPNLAQALVVWQQVHGRHALPWQNTTDAYRIWLSEIMLQQTQVSTVLEYYTRFLEALPNVNALANASQEQVLALWAGLGYYSRARNLHACARTVVDEHQGEFPRTPEALVLLKGIGASTAAAIAVFAYGHPAAICDGNVKRILSRVYGIESIPSAATDKHLWQLAERTLISAADAHTLGISHAEALRAYTQGVMDLGSGVCRKHQPQCPECPWQNKCNAHRTQRQHLIPAAKPKTTVQTRAFNWHIYLYQGQVWLEQQSERGIWAKLWSFPDSARLPPDTPFNARTLEPIRHRLTHRLLIITAHIIELHPPQQLQLDDTTTGRWIPLQPSNQPSNKLAIPTPVSAMLEQLVREYPCT